MRITSRKNERVARFRRLAASASYRRESGEFICDGWKLFEEAVKWGAGIDEVMISGEPRFTPPEGVTVHEVTPEVMEAASPARTPQGVVFTVRIPERVPPESISGAMILENIQDPGNVGTILRTANAFGVPLVVLTGECADIYGPKTVRASMGAIFRQRTAELSIDELRALTATAPIYGAALREDAADLRKCSLEGCAAAVGNEGSGLTRELLELCAGTVIIPMSPACESLNAAVAASILMWETRGRRLPV